MIKTIFNAARAITLPGADAVPLNHEILGDWESLTLDDAGIGEFVTLPNGAQMHYVTAGPLEPSESRGDIVLIHGIMDSTYNWKKNIQALAQKHRVWAVDLPGFGFSTRLTERVYTFKNFALWVRDFMNIMEIQRATVIGHSMGGGITLQFAYDYPQRVERLVVLNPAAYLWIPGLVRFFARMPLIPRAIVQMMMNSRRVHSAMWRMIIGASPFDATEIARRSRHLRVKGTLDALIALLASPRETDLPRGLGKIAAPTLVLWGARDQVVPVEHGARLVRELPQARLQVLPTAGHIPQEECPREINAAMVSYLNENLDGSRS